MGILSLIQHLCEIIIPHNLALSALVVVDGLRLELLRQPSHLRNVLLKISELILGIGDLCVQIADILNDIIDISIQPVIFVLVSNDLLLQDVLLTFQLSCVLLKVVDLALDVVVVESEFFGVARQEFVVLSHAGCGLVEPESFVEELLVVG